MVQMEDPQTPLDLRVLYANGVHLMLGLYGWEYLRSLQVESGLIFGRVAFRPSLIPYILGRLSLLVYLVLLAIGTSPYSHGIGCVAGAMTIYTSGSLVLGCSSTNFMIRAWVIWKDSRLMHAFLSLLALGQLVIFIAGTLLLKAVTTHGVCEVYSTYRQSNGVTYLYTLVYDLFVLGFSAVGLSTQPWISYIPPTVSSFLDNPFVDNLMSVVVFTTSTITSSWAVRSLLFLDMNETNQNSVIALDTQVGVPRGTVAQDGVSTRGQRSIDEADRC